MTEPRFDARYKPVTCAECKRMFTCTPADDYYNWTTDADGFCFLCLLASHDLRPA